MGLRLSKNLSAGTTINGKIKKERKSQKQTKGKENKNKSKANVNPSQSGAERERNNEDEPIILKKVKALYDYTSTETTDLTFSVGDCMHVYDMSDSDWWRAKHLPTGKVGFIPNNYVAEDDSLESNDWYFGDMSRKKSETCLIQIKKQGYFLVRESERDPGNYTLSVSAFGKKSNAIEIKHYRIRTLDNNEGFYISQTAQFPSLVELIAHYSNDAHGLCCTLVRACPRPTPTLYDLTSDTKNSWEIERDDLTLLNKLGHGQFGEVYRARYVNGTEVAVKTLKAGTMSISQFLSEADVMKKCRHPNLVTLFAICSKTEPIYIVTELMDGGSLLSYLRGPNSRGIKLEDYIDFSSQCAAGMAYLEENKFVHRDLAARNVLISLANKDLKIADFGLARAIDEDIYIAAQGAKFPIKWTAIEAAQYGKFTIKSDVWSYGILLVEIFTKGQNPYPDMSNCDVLGKLENGYRMPQYEDVPDPVYSCMLKCWEKSPEARPTFEHLQYFFDTYNVSSQGNYLDSVTPN